MLNKRISHYLTYILLVFAVAIPAFSEPLTGAEIIKLVDRNSIFEKMEYNGKMTIKKKKKVRTKSMHIYAQGEEKALIEFTNPEDEGTRYLRLSGELWMYFPDAEEIIKIWIVGKKDMPPNVPGEAFFIYETGGQAPYIRILFVDSPVLVSNFVKPPGGSKTCWTCPYNYDSLFTHLHALRRTMLFS